MRQVVIKAGQVVNVIEAAPGFALEGFELVASDAAGPGWSYVDGAFVAPIAPAPSDAAQKRARAAAFMAEADPLYFKAARGEASMAEWAAKVDEIRARFPYLTD